MDKKVEQVIIIIAIIGVCFRLMNFMGGNIIMILSFGSLSIFYLTFGVLILNNAPDSKNIKKSAFGRSITGVVMSVSVIGLLFKMVLWPGANMLLTIGLIGLLSSGLIVYIKYKRTDSSYHKLILKRILYIGILVGSLVSIPTSTWLHMHYPNNPEYVKAELELRENSQDKALQEKVRVEKEKMNKRDADH